MRTSKIIAGLSLLGFLSTTIAYASTVNVDATDVIYAAGNQSSFAATGGGTLPVDISAAGVSSFGFSTSGSISFDSGAHYNNPDGIGAGSPTFWGRGYGNLSGIDMPDAGELVGVFVTPGGPSGSSPVALNFFGDTGFGSLSPLLDQVFYIGDGLTGNGAGSGQTFIVPTGATDLYLGIADGCSYGGPPSCYADNLGSFNVTVNPTLSPAPAPEPSSILLFGTGALLLAGCVSFRRRLTLAEISD